MQRSAGPRIKVGRQVWDVAADPARCQGRVQTVSGWGGKADARWHVLGLLAAGAGSGQCPSPALCRYRKFSIAEDVDIIVRCQIDGVMPYKGEEQLLSVKALNEFDSKTTGKPALLFHILVA